MDGVVASGLWGACAGVRGGAADRGGLQPADLSLYLELPGRHPEPGSGWMTRIFSVQRAAFLACCFQSRSLKMRIALTLAHLVRVYPLFPHLPPPPLPPPPFEQGERKQSQSPLEAANEAKIKRLPRLAFSRFSAQVLPCWIAKNLEAFLEAAGQRQSKSPPRRDSELTDARADAAQEVARRAPKAAAAAAGEAAGGEDAGMDGVVASGLWGAPARESGEARRIGEVRNRPTLSVYLSLPFFLPVCVCMRRRVYALNRQCRQTTLTSAMLSLWFRRTPSSGDEASGFYLS